MSAAVFNAVLGMSAKRCTGCGCLLPVMCFGSDGRGGRESRCKDCRAERQRDYYQRDGRRVRYTTGCRARSAA